MHVLPMNASYTEMQHDLFASMEMNKKHSLYTVSSTHLDVYKRQTLASVNLSDAEKIFNSYPDELSGGMLQRVMIALTMLQAPKLIIADEITTAVDAASEYQILNQLEKIKASGVSLLVITHDFGVVAKLCDRVAVMKSGEIIEQGKTHEVLSTPQHDYTKQLMEASILFQEALC